jgi:hypothetical protein
LTFWRLGSEGRPSAGTVEVEYRLACSGALYNRNIKTGDWRKSDATRALLRTPFELFVASHPFDDYPQELCARLVVNRAIESDQSFTRGFLPDEDVIEDLGSLLTLLSRRLITPVGKIRERHPSGIDGLGSYGEDVPIPIMGTPKSPFGREDQPRLSQQSRSRISSLKIHRQLALMTTRFRHSSEPFPRLNSPKIS